MFEVRVPPGWVQVRRLHHTNLHLALVVAGCVHHTQTGRLAAGRDSLDQNQKSSERDGNLSLCVAAMGI